MNIQQATDQIRGAIRAYLSVDDSGMPRIPVRSQRPIVMFGPPGVGKTAVVAQVAEELDINFVSYSITHHTRQSALGLPFIYEEEFGGAKHSVSEYTMSEIIAATYRAQRESGVSEGILFLDEINCVSETLAPAMLQFLQHKTFGMHKLPEGWVVVCACNPPEYNRSAREFDPAMLDRLKRIDVEPSLEVWQEYAATRGIHPAVTTFLESKPDSFYKVQASVRGAQLVTPRGWEDLSRIVSAYEAEGLEVDESLVRQYLQDDQTAREFAMYYELFRKYRDDYKIADILSGSPSAAMSASRAREARFDERMALVGLVHEQVLARVHKAIELEEALQLVRDDLLALKPALEADGCAAGSQALADREDEIRLATTVGTLSKGQVADRETVKGLRLRVMAALVRGTALAETASPAPANAFDAAKAAYNREVASQRELADAADAALGNAFRFMDGAFGEDSQEALVLITRLSADKLLVKFVSEYGSDEFVKHNKSLLFTERGIDLMQAIEALQAEDGLQAATGFTFNS